MTEKIFRIIEEKAQEYKDLLRDMVMLESYTPEKADVDKLGAFIKNFAESKGLTVTVKPFPKAGDGLLITMNEDAPLPPVVFTGHMDTVHPRGVFRDPVFREEDGVFYGPGVQDMKGGLAQGLLVMDALKIAGYGKRPVKFIMISDEELSEGLSGEAGKDFIRDNARGAAAALTLEGGGKGSICVGRKGSIRYRVFVHGKATHAGAQYKEGISAIKEAAQKILAIEAPSDQEQITYNCGLFSGGTSPNTVPGEATFTLYNRYWEMKQRDEIKRHVEGIINKSFIPGTTADFEIIGERYPMEATPANYALAAFISGVSEKYGWGEMKPYKASAGSDASYTTMAGAPSVCTMGPLGANVHSPKELMYADSLPERAKLVAAVVNELPDDFGKDF